MSIFDLFKSKKSHRTGTGIYKDGREISYDEKITDIIEVTTDEWADKSGLSTTEARRQVEDAFK